MQQEYRWEFVESGQGHFHSDLGDCFSEAVLKSHRRPNHIIKIEIFRPKQEVIGFLKDGEFITPKRQKKWFRKAWFIELELEKG